MIRERLFKFLNKFNQISFKSSKFVFPILIIFILVLISLFSGKQDLKKDVKSARIQAVAEKKITVSPIPSPQVHKASMKISGEVSVEKIVPTSMPGPIPASPVTNSQGDNSGLLKAVNTFRNLNVAAPIGSNDSLCTIAGKRLEELVELGHLDSHAGFGKFFSGQTEFNAMGEIIFQSSAPQTPDYAVNQGWAKSADGHRENMLDPKWNYGCGATNGYFAVFNFGKK